MMAFEGLTTRFYITETKDKVVNRIKLLRLDFDFVEIY